MSHLDNSIVNRKKLSFFCVICDLVTEEIHEVVILFIRVYREKSLWEEKVKTREELAKRREENARRMELEHDQRVRDEVSK